MYILKISMLNVLHDIRHWNVVAGVQSVVVRGKSVCGGVA